MSQESFEELTNAIHIHRMLADSGYSEKAIQYFLQKPHMGAIPDADQVSAMTGSCGDTMSICLKVQNGVIQDARYQVLGCPGAIASAMAVVDLIKGKKLVDARTLNDGDVFRALQEIPVQKHHCIQLAVKTFQKALDEYTQNQFNEAKKYAILIEESARGERLIFTLPGSSLRESIELLRQHQTFCSVCSKQGMHSVFPSNLLGARGVTSALQFTIPVPIPMLHVLVKLHHCNEIEVLIWECLFAISLEAVCRHLVLFLAFESIQRSRDVHLWKVAPADYAAITAIVTGEPKSPDH